MEIKITTLAENTAEMGYLAEWGLSMFIEADGKKVLFDTGMGIAAIHNAQLFGIDLAKVDKIVLSHGHRDHTGGLREVMMRVKKEVEVIAHPDIWAAKYSRRGKQPERFAGLPFRRELLESLGARFYLTAKPVRITSRFFTTGEIPMLTHHGIINTLKQAQKVTGKELIYAAIGGTHLLNAPKERWQKTAADLKEMGVQYLGVSHCTGFEASAYLAQEFGDRFFVNNSGSRWTLPFKT